jgi:hypothetical protein
MIIIDGDGRPCTLVYRYSGVAARGLLDGKPAHSGLRFGPRFLLELRRLLAGLPPGKR